MVGDGQGDFSLREKIKNIIKRTVIAVGMVAFVVTGYLTVSVSTSCTAEAASCTCSGPCILPGSISAAFIAVATNATTNIASVVAAYTVDFNVKIQSLESAAKARIKSTQGNLVALYDTLWFYNMKPAMQAMTQQINARDAGQTQMLAAFQDAMAVNRQNLKLMEKQLQSHREQRPSEQACVAATATGGMTSALTVTRAYATAASKEALPRSMNSILSKSFSSMDADRLADEHGLIRPAYAATPSAPASLGAAADLADRWTHYIENYCDHRANAKNAGCSSSAPYRNKDLDVTGQIFSKSTIDMSATGPKGTPLNKMFADDIVTNLAEPFVTDNIPPAVLKTGPGQEEMLARQSYRSQRQTVYDMIYDSVARRVPSSNGGTSATFINELRRAAGVDATQLSSNPSYEEVMQVMMSERFHTGSLSVDQVDDPNNNAREMVIQQAMQAMELNDILNRIDKYSTFLAAQTGNDVVKTRKPPTNSKNTAIVPSAGGSK